MNSKFLLWFVVNPLYFLMLITRFLFLKSRVGQLTHNLLFYACGKLVATQPEHRRKYNLLLNGMLFKNKCVEWQKVIYTSNPNCWKHFLKNVFAYRLIVGSVKRRYLSYKGHVVPSTIAVSLNMPGEGCNLSCKHCYAKGHEDLQMTLLLLEKIASEGENLGTFSILMLGGEPFLWPWIWEIFEKYPRTTFWVATNGTLLDRDKIRRISELGNVVPLISIEGFEKETDEMRGVGVFSKVMSAMRLCREYKLLFVVTVCVQKNNFHVVTTDQFVKMLAELRCICVNYSCYVPIGKDANKDWQISEKQSEILDEWGGHIVEHYPMFVSIGRNGTNRVSDCYAARQYIHILPDGKVEPCPFAHYSNPNLNFFKQSVLEVTGSEFFKSVRFINSLAVPGLTLCRKNPLLEKYFKSLGVVHNFKKEEVI